LRSSESGEAKSKGQKASDITRDVSVDFTEEKGNTELKLNFNFTIVLHKNILEDMCNL
jgi:hypothetical protein